MHLIIDGYNVIKSAQEFIYHNSQLQTQREQFNKLLSQYKTKTGYRITVVYDGTKGISSLQTYEHISGIEVIYSRSGETADEVIKRLVEEGKNPAEIFVASSDREVKEYAQSCGACVVPAQELYKKLSAVDSSKYDSEKLDSATYFERHVKGYIEEEDYGNSSKKGSAFKQKKKKRRGPKLW